MLLRLLPLVALVACSDAPAPVKAARPDKALAVEAAMSQAPVPRTYRYTDGEMRVFEVPVDSGGFLDRQRCVVWRDEVYKTASISCGQQPEVLLSN